MADAPTYVNYQTGQPGPIVGSSIADGSISTAQLADGAVTNVKITVSAVSSGNIITGTIIATNIANNAITNAKLATQSAATFKGRGFGSADGDPTSLSKNQAITIITSGNADEISQSGNRWGVFTYIASDGVMEVGKYLDFQNDDASTSNYAVRIQSSGTTGLVLNENAVFGRFLLTAGSVVGGQNITVTISGTFENYYIKTHLLPVVNNAVPYLRYMQGGNSVANTSSYGWSYQSGTLVSATAADNFIKINGPIGNTGIVTPAQNEIWLTRPAASTFCKAVTYIALGWVGGGSPYNTTGGGVMVSNSAAIEGVLIFFASAATVTVRNGSINFGLYWVYGDMGSI